MKYQNNVGLLVTSIFQKGGVQKYLRELAIIFIQDRNLLNANFYLVSYLDSTTSKSGFELFQDNYCHFCNKSKLKLFNALIFSRGFDILYVGHISMLPLALWLKFTGRVNKIVLITHGIEVWKPLTFLEKVGLVFCTTIINTTPYTTSMMKKFNTFKSSKILEIPLTAFDREIRHEKVFDKNVKETKLNLLFIGRMESRERYKGLDHTINSIAMLDELKIPIFLTVVGEGDDKKYYQDIVLERNLESCIEFIGSVDDYELENIYSKSDVLVMPSLNEGFGIVYLEAMSRGIPSIACKSGGAQYVIDHEHTGFLVSYGDIYELSCLLKKIANYPEVLADMRSKCINMYRQKFSYQKFVSTHIELLKKLL